MTLSRYLARSHLKTRMRNQVGGHRLVSTTAAVDCLFSIAIDFALT
jgi:hypothetical protein